MEVMREMPKTLLVRITVEEMDGQGQPVPDSEQVRFAHGTVADVMAALFHEKSPRKKRMRRTRKEIELAQKMLRSNDPPMEGAPAPEAKPRKKREKVWPTEDKA